MFTQEAAKGAVDLAREVVETVRQRFDGVPPAGDAEDGEPVGQPPTPT